MAGTLLSVPWERAFGYVQGVQAGETIYISEQLSHDDHGVEGALCGRVPCAAAHR